MDGPASATYVYTHVLSGHVTDKLLLFLPAFDVVAGGGGVYWFW